MARPASASTTAPSKREQRLAKRYKSQQQQAKSPRKIGELLRSKYAVIGGLLLVLLVISAFRTAAQLSAASRSPTADNVVARPGSSSTSSSSKYAVEPEYPDELARARAMARQAAMRRRAEEPEPLDAANAHVDVAEPVNEEEESHKRAAAAVAMGNAAAVADGGEPDDDLAAAATARVANSPEEEEQDDAPTRLLKDLSADELQQVLKAMYEYQPEGEDDAE